MSEQHLQGTHCYDILRNNKYIQDFQYVAAYQENREDFIIDNDDRNDNNTAQSDLVRIALNVGFLTEKEV